MSSEGPLSDVRVVEMTVHRAGPLCGSLLADMGAEVLEIERPGVGDPARTQGVGPEGRSAYFMGNGGNRKSVTHPVARARTRRTHRSGIPDVVGEQTTLSEWADRGAFGG